MNSTNSDLGDRTNSTELFSEPERVSARQAPLSINPVLFQLAEAGVSQPDSIQESSAAAIVSSQNLAGVFRVWAASRIPLSQKQTRSSISQRLSEDVATIDRALNRQVDAILHHVSFQKMESTWRGLFYLINQAEQANIDAGRRIGGEQCIKIRILSVKKRELRRDQETAVEFDRSDLWKKVYEEEFGTAGGTPYGLLISDHEFSHHPEDVSLLSGMSETAMAAFVPLIVTPKPEIVGVNDFGSLENLPPISETQAAPSYTKWRALREREESRFIGLPVPRVLGRYGYDGLIGSPDAQPAKESTWSQRGFRYRERIEQKRGSGRLWMSGVWPFASVVIREFGRSGWFADIRGSSRAVGDGGQVEGLPVDTFPGFEKSNVRRGPTEFLIPIAMEDEFEDAGLIPLAGMGPDGRAVFHSNMSLHKPKVFDKRNVTENERLSSMLQYVLCVSRFAQYLKVILREKLGSFTEAPDVEKFLNDWIHRYVTPDDQASVETRAKMPLRAAEIEVRDEPGSGGAFRIIMRLQPHFQIDRIESTLRLVSAVRYDPSKLSPKR